MNPLRFNVFTFVPDMSFSFFEIIRINRWWLYKAAPLMGIAYLFIYANRISFPDSIFLLFLFLIALTGIAGMGYFINDFFDRQTDLRAGKANLLARLPWKKLVMIFSVLLVLSVIPWYFLPHSKIIIIIICIQYVLYLAYSSPLFRLKETPVLGVFCDALYGHLIPLLLTAFIFYFAGDLVGAGTSVRQDGFSFFEKFITAGCTWQLLKGIRNLLVHQVEDRRNDRRSGTRTFVNLYGAVFTADIINYIVIPLEFISFLALIFILTDYFILLSLIFVIFLVWNFFTLEVWRKGNIFRLRYKNRFFYCLNDFYEMWMPVVFLIYLCSIDAWYVIVLLIHLVLFRKVFHRLIGDIKGIRNVIGI